MIDQQTSWPLAPYGCLYCRVGPDQPHNRPDCPAAFPHRMRTRVRPEPPRCYRCHFWAFATWVEVTNLGDPEPRYALASAECSTPGCVDELGTRSPIPPSPQDLQDRAARIWLARQRALARGERL